MLSWDLNAVGKVSEFKSYPFLVADVAEPYHLQAAGLERKLNVLSRWTWNCCPRDISLLDIKMDRVVVALVLENGDLGYHIGDPVCSFSIVILKKDW